MKTKRIVSFSSTASSRGFTLVELIVSLLISTFVFAGLFHQIRSSVEHAKDHQIRLETFVQTQAVVQTLSGELRMAGNGVPFDQQNFVIGDLNLSDPTVTEPLSVADCTASKIVARLNETGEVFLLTSSFDPSGSLTLSLTETGQLAVGDPVYLSNSVVSGDDGLYGTVAAVSEEWDTITLNSGFVSSPGAVFPAGSILEEVPLVTYESADNMITRNSGFGPVLLASNAMMSIKYLDIDGTELSLPLSASDLVNALRSVEVTVTLTSNKKLSSGEDYSTSVSQRIGIRNLDYLF